MRNSEGGIRHVNDVFGSFKPLECLKSFVIFNLMGYSSNYTTFGCQEN